MLSTLDFTSDAPPEAYPAAYVWYHDTNTLAIQKASFRLRTINLLFSLRTNIIPVTRQCVFSIETRTDRKRIERKKDVDVHLYTASNVSPPTPVEFMVGFAVLIVFFLVLTILLLCFAFMVLGVCSIMCLCTIVSIFLKSVVENK